MKSSEVGTRSKHEWVGDKVECGGDARVWDGTVLVGLELQIVGSGRAKGQ